MKVIVIEDNILFCDYICSLLQKADFKTMKAHGLAQAKKMIRGSIHEDDMVLADLRLPDGESTALLKWMRDNGYMHPFIMMTNYEEIHSAVHAMKLGAEDFILKPLVEDKLFTRHKKDKSGKRYFFQSDLRTQECLFLRIEPIYPPGCTNRHDSVDTGEHGNRKRTSGK